MKINLPKIKMPKLAMPKFVFKALPLKRKMEIVAQVVIYLVTSAGLQQFLFNRLAGPFSLPLFLYGLALALPYVLVYVIAFKLLKSTNSIERWSLFILSFVLIPLSLAVAKILGDKLKNPWASMLAVVAGFVATQFVLSWGYNYYLTLLQQLFSAAF